MQTMICYVSAVNTLGAVRDYANARNETAPAFTRGVGVCLKMRLFASSDTPESYPLAELSAIPAWQFVMDDDFDSSSNYILVADHSDISVAQVTETINDTECTFTEITIPVSQMNTEELNTLLGTKESIATLNGELVGFDGNGNEVFVLQVKGFTVRNRISSTGNPTELASEYLNEAQVRSLCSAGLDVIFSEILSETAADWHTVQTTADKFFRVRLKGDYRIWTNGVPADAGWSGAFGLLIGAKGESGTDGNTYYTHVAFATDGAGSDFITDGTEWTVNHKYIAFLTSTEENVSAADFAGLWVKFIIDSADNIRITDVGNYFSRSTVESALQEVGATLAGLEHALGEI